MFCACYNSNFIIQLFSEDFVKFRFTVFSAIIFILSSLTAVSAQIDSAIGQITSSATQTFVGGINGNGRFVVFESTGDIATENPRNADGNLEIFLFDYAQRRIFQITDTRNLLVTTTSGTTTTTQIQVSVLNTRPVISNDGKWIAFGSNATCNFPGTTAISAITNGGNPGSFDPNTLPACVVGTGTGAKNNLPNDGNTEMWFYRIPDVASVNLALGTELSATDLSAGTFVQATNSLPSEPSVAGTDTSAPFIADDNRVPAINDNGGFVAFMSNRDLQPCPTTASATCGNASGFDNDEIFLAVLTPNGSNFSVSLKQITATPQGTIQIPSNNDNPSISGNGLRIAFSSTGNNPVRGVTGSGNNTDRNEEVFYADVDASGTPTGQGQVTRTTPATLGNVVNNFNYGKRMSRDGVYIAFDSYADLEAVNNPIQSSFATYLYNVSATTFRKIGPRSDADAAATGGDLPRFPTFTDYNGLAPNTLVLETRLNINASGTVPATATDGLNSDTTRPAQVYSFPLNNANPTFTRLTKLPAPSFFLAFIQPFTSDSLKRITFNLSQTEPGTGNTDLLAEAFYLLAPTQTTENTTATLSYATGASRITVTASPVPTPAASPSPTPQTPTAVQGVSPGMLAIANLSTGFTQPVVSQTAVGSLNRRFTLPIELSGVTVTINGVASGIKEVSTNEVIFVVPRAIPASDTPYSIVINNNGEVIKGTILIVITRPDVFTFNTMPGPGGRAWVLNATNRVLTREPFNVTTLKYKGGLRVPTVLRLYLTGVEGAGAANFVIRIGSVTIPATNILTGAVLREPGVYSVDFTLPSSLDKAGDQPIIISILANGVTYDARLDDTAPRLRIL